tara:strand:+ start:97 stop:240 length:144 start_codon:yes stop_codon:yes gene_type:complete
MSEYTLTIRRDGIDVVYVNTDEASDIILAMNVDEYESSEKISGMCNE